MPSNLYILSEEARLLSRIHRKYSEHMPSGSIILSEEARLLSRRGRRYSGLIRKPYSSFPFTPMPAQSSRNKEEGLVLKLKGAKRGTTTDSNYCHH